MPSYVTPKKNTQFICYIGLPSVANADNFQTNPTLAAGDVTVSVDGAAAANITTLPSADPAGGKRIKVTLSADEMNGDNIQVLFSDVTGGEWKDVLINIQTTLNQVDSLSLESTVSALLTTAVADSTPAEGARPSVAQGMLMVTRLLTEAVAAAGTLTVYKEDGVTPVMTFTLNDPTNPTGITRAT